MAMPASTQNTCSHMHQRALLESSCLLSSLVMFTSKERTVADASIPSGRPSTSWLWR